jgi:hypothetical protein
MASPNDSREKILAAITSPLGFYVLALLVVESFIGVVALKTDPKCDVISTALNWGAGLFILVLVIVTVLVWFKAKELVYDAPSHIKSIETPAPIDGQRKPKQKTPTSNARPAIKEDPQ